MKLIEEITVINKVSIVSKNPGCNIYFDGVLVSIWNKNLDYADILNHVAQLSFDHGVRSNVAEHELQQAKEKGWDDGYKAGMIDKQNEFKNVLGIGDDDDID